MGMGMGMGGGMPGPLGDKFGWLANFHQTVASVGMITEMVGMNAQALHHAFGAVMHFVGQAGSLVGELLGAKPAPRLGPAGELLELTPQEEEERRRRLRVSRLLAGALAGYLVYRGLRKALSWLFGFGGSAAAAGGASAAAAAGGSAAASAASLGVAARATLGGAAFAAPLRAAHRYPQLLPAPTAAPPSFDDIYGEACGVAGGAGAAAAAMEALPAGAAEGAAADGTVGLGLE
jgi:hypothetical protein